MRVIENLNTCAKLGHPCAVTIGGFDGVHLGHQKILQEMRRLVDCNGYTCVVTFSNHPSDILSHGDPVELIYSKEEKFYWLKHFGVDCTYNIPFSPQLAALSYTDFLCCFHEICPFSHLVLGQDARLGSGREGTPERIAPLCTIFGAIAHYLNKVVQGEGEISSSRIRSLLRQNKRVEAERLLGHPLKRASYH